MTVPSGSRKVALVTGGARGIGQGIVAEFARDHAVGVHYNTTIPDLTGPDICAVQGDLSDPAFAEAIVAAVLDRFGRIDVIVNNAGVAVPSPVDAVEPEALRRMLDVNVLAPQYILAAALAHLEPGATIVSISSVNAVLPPRGASLFGASKAALELWTKGIAKELGPRGIRVNAVSPGAIDVEDAPRDEALRTAFRDMTALGRLGTPADIAAAVRFLASDAASFITGEVLVVSGGFRL